MELPPLSVSSITPVQPSAEQAKGDLFLPPAVHIEGEGEMWLGIVQNVLIKMPVHLTRGMGKHRIKPEKGQPHTAVSLKGSVGNKIDQHAFGARSSLTQGLQSGFKAARDPTSQLKGDVGPKVDPTKEMFAAKYSAFAHKLSMKEVRGRIHDIFIRRDGSEKANGGVRDFRPLDASLERRLDTQKCKAESLAEKVDPTNDTEKAKRAETDIRLVREKNKDRAKETEQSEKVVPAEIHRIPPQAPDRIPPELFLGLGMLTATVQQMVASPEFQSAKAVLVVQGVIQKAFISHIMKLFGRFHKQVYVWALGPGDSLGAAWSFLKGVSMPHATLLDLNVGRRNGGWDAIKLVLRTLRVADKHGLETINDEEIAALPHWDAPVVGMGPWLERLERHGIFFSLPLDFDYMLLRAFPEAYASIPVRKAVPKNVGLAVLDIQPETLGAYFETDIDTLNQYYQFFYLDNRLLVHQQAWRQLNMAEMMEGLPPVLHRLLQRLAGGSAAA